MALSILSHPVRKTQKGEEAGDSVCLLYVGLFPMRTCQLTRWLCILIDIEKTDKNHLGCCVQNILSLHSGSAKKGFWDWWVSTQFAAKPLPCTNVCWIEKWSDKWLLSSLLRQTIFRPYMAKWFDPQGCPTRRLRLNIAIETNTHRIKASCPARVDN